MAGTIAILSRCDAAGSGHHLLFSALMRTTAPLVLISCRCSEVRGPFPTSATVSEALMMLHSCPGEPHRNSALGTSACLSHSGAGQGFLQQPSHHHQPCAKSET